ncbi:MAG: hypothetical protein IJA30_03660 [Bacilli bacterium]|nr:hypothetical protein [Bacilli bacterium]
MDYEFSSKEELFQRVKPALKAKVNEFKRLGYKYVQEVDVWNYLIENVWCKAKDLMLSDIVNDILHVKIKKIDDYIKEKMSSTNRTQYFDSNN